MIRVIYFRHSPHRSVTVYRLIGKDTVEEAILHCAQTKLRLEQDMALADSGELVIYTFICLFFHHLPLTLSYVQFHVLSLRLIFF